MKKKYTYIVVIIILSIVITIQNLGYTHNFIGEDSGVFFDFPHPLFRFTYHMWDDLTGPGKANVTSTFNFIWLNMVLLFYKVGLSNILLKRLIYAAFISVSGIGAFLLIKLLLLLATKKNQEILLFPAFIGSLIYIFNHFYMELLSFPINPYHVSYMLFPIIVYLFIRNIFNKITIHTHIVFILTSFILLSSNPANTLAIAIFLLSYLIYFWSDVPKKQKAIIFLIQSFICVTLLASYIILPNITVHNPYGYSGTQVDLVQSLAVHSVFTSFDNLIRLAAPADWDRYSYTNIYETHIFVFLGYLIPIGVVSSLFVKSYQKIKTFFLIIILLSLFFAKGMHMPFENIFLFIFNSVPLFGIYRAAYPKFIYFAVLGYAVLMSFTIFFLQEKLKKNKYSLYLLLIIPILIFVYYFPYFTGQLLDQDTLTLIPPDYKNASKILEGDTTDSKILALPPAPRGAGLLLNWDKNKYVGPHPDSFFFNKPVIDSYWFIEKGYNNLTIYNSWRGTVFEENIESIINLAPFFNVKYLLVHKDFLNEYQFGENNIYKIDGTRKAQVLINNVRKLPGIKVIAENKQFNVYELPGSTFYPKIYIPDRIITTKDPLQYLFNSFKEDSSIQKELVTDKNINLIDNKSAKFKYTKNSPTNYTLYFSNFSSSVPIVFSETFHNNWTIQEVDKANHFIANGYANGWVIDPQTICRRLNCERNRNNTYNFSLELSYQPQKLFKIGLVLSFSTFILLVGALVYFPIRNRRYRYEKVNR